MVVLFQALLMLFDNQLGGSRSSIVRTWTWELGSGKVAGKVLIVDLF